MDNHQQVYLNICSFRELFSGRFTEDETSFLLERFHGDLQDTINFVMHSEPAEVRQAISEEQDTWNVVGKISGLKEENSNVLKSARTGRIDTSAHMFSCGKCDHFWWKRVPGRKKVSKCNKCHQRYDALARDREWGWAQFFCTGCRRQFNGYCAMWLKSPCYQCLTEVAPTRICPPTQRDDRRSRNTHQCAAPDCVGHSHHPMVGQVGHRPHYIRGDDGQLLPLSCVHPRSRRQNSLPIVVVKSHEHDSTGSTVNTFLPQDDLTAAYQTIPLPTVAEELSDD